MHAWGHVQIVHRTSDVQETFQTTMITGIEMKRLAYTFINKGTGL